MRSTTEGPETDRRKGARRRSPTMMSSPLTGALAAAGGERREQTERRGNGATSGMRMKAANGTTSSPLSEQDIAQSMIDALTDILRYEQTQKRSQKAS